MTSRPGLDREQDLDDPPSSRKIEDFLYPERKALAKLMHSSELGAGDVGSALELVTEVAARVLRVERASVWRFNADRSALECEDLFERTRQTHQREPSLPAAAFPAYFQALAEERSIAARNAHTDPRTREFSESYLHPNGIGAMLDAPVFMRGEMVGVVCHEHVGGARDWQGWEELIAGSIADFVALALESSERAAAQSRLKEHQQRLEQEVAARTAELMTANELLQHEIAERKRAEQNFKDLFEVSPVALILSRALDQRVLMGNRRSSELFEIPDNRLAGKFAPDYYVHPEERARLLARVEREGYVDGYQTELKTDTGRTFPALMSAQRLVYAGEPALLISAVDVTNQKLTENRLRELATLDSLTGCYNRRHFLELGAAEFERGARYKRPISVAMLDADHFKHINDAFGHDVGDQALRMIADTGKRVLRRTDIFGRVGGEEFAIVFVETGLSEASKVTDRFLAAVGQSGLVAGGAPVPITLSAGVTERASEESLATALKRADDALYRAKQAGRNRTVAG